MPLLLVFLAGGVGGFVLSSKADNLAKYALAGAAVYVGGKYVKAW